MLRPSAWLGSIVLLAWAAPHAGADDRPIPLDPARVERRSREMLAWNRRTLVGEYDRAGRKDPRWDSAVREALELTARRFSYQDPFPQPEEMHRLAKRAIDAGSADPLILYVYSRTSTKPDDFPGIDEFVRRSRRAAHALRASSYSPLRRAYGQYQGIATRLGSGTVAESDWPRLARELDEVVELIGPSSQIDPRGEFWEASWYETLWEVYGAHRQINRNQAQAAFDRVDGLLARVPGVEALRLTFRGKFFAEFAWEARGDRGAAATSATQFAGFEERLAESRRALEAAYQLDPDEPNVARNRVLIARGLGEDRATMETWFARAVAIDPDNEDAYVSKFYYLSPRWLGDAAGRDALAFGLACGATKNWRNGVELLGPEAIYYQAMNLGPAARRAYMTRPENWATIRATCDDYLQRYPGNAIVLSKYAFFAYLCEQYEAADAIFRRVGDDLTRWDGMNSVSLAGLKGFRAFCADKAAAKNATPTPNLTPTGLP